MTDPKCIHARIDGLASMDLPEGHAPEVLCTVTDIGGMVCTGEEGCRFFSAEPDLSFLHEAIARGMMNSPFESDGSTWSDMCLEIAGESGKGLTIYDLREFTIDGRVNLIEMASAAIDAIHAAGYDIVPRK